MKDEDKIWLAVGELGEYFSRLGGAARPFNMKESEIFLYVGCLLVEKYSPDFNKSEFLDSQFITAAQPVLDKTINYLNEVKSTDKELLLIIISFVNHYKTKLAKHETHRWNKFVEFCEELNIEEAKL